MRYLSVAILAAVWAVSPAAAQPGQRGDQAKQLEAQIQKLQAQIKALETQLNKSRDGGDRREGEKKRPEAKREGEKKRDSGAREGERRDVENKRPEATRDGERGERRDGDRGGPGARDGDRRGPGVPPGRLGAGAGGGMGGRVSSDVIRRIDRIIGELEQMKREINGGGDMNRGPGVPRGFGPRGPAFGGPGGPGGPRGGPPFRGPGGSGGSRGGSTSERQS